MVSAIGLGDRIDIAELSDRDVKDGSIEESGMAGDDNAGGSEEGTAHEAEFPCELTEGDPPKSFGMRYLLRGEADIELLQVVCEEYLDKVRKR